MTSNEAGVSINPRDVRTRGRSMSAALPHGVVAFLMSDVEGSSAWWTTDATAMPGAVAALDLAVARFVGAAGVHLLKARGEDHSHFAVFDCPSDAVRAGLALHRGLRVTEGHRGGVELRVRVAVHVGEARPTGADYYGMVVIRRRGCGRLSTAARCCCLVPRLCSPSPHSMVTSD
jgi:hypothetical protein